MNNKLKGVLILIVFVLFFLAGVNTVQAKIGSQDVTVECTNTGCSILNSPTLMFGEYNMAPGDSVSQNLIIKNLRNETCDALISVDEKTEQEEEESSSNKLPEVIKSTISYAPTTYFNDWLKNLFVAGPIGIGSIPAGQTRSIKWVNEFDVNAGNEYQGLVTKFDVDINITCASGNGDGGGDSVSGDDPNDKHDGPKTTSTGGSAPTVAGIATGFNFAPFLNETLDANETTPESPIVPVVGATPEVAGAETVCANPWWWWLLFIIQAILHFFVNKQINKDTYKKPNKYYLANVVVLGIFAWYYYKNFCINWDYLISLAIGALAILAEGYKIDKLTKNNK